VAHNDKNDKDRDEEKSRAESRRGWEAMIMEHVRAGSGVSYLLDDDELAGRILGERVHHGVERVHHTRTLPGASPGENELTIKEKEEHG
jgi:hypothetical protein